jgi:two-component system, response regulator
MDNKVVEILLIEDNMQDAELTIRTLKKSNLAHHILHLRDGAEAIQFLYPPTASSWSSNLKMILLDLKMPKVNGLEVLKRIKSSERTRTIPTIVLTSSKQEHDISEALSAGANSYIVKPVAYDQFSETVSRIGFYWLKLNQSLK